MDSRKLVSLTLGTLAALSLSVNVLANCGDDCGECTSNVIDNCGVYYPSGAYIGLSAGYAGYWWKDLGGLTDFGSRFDVTANNGAVAARASVGYDFNPNFQAELGYLYVYQMRINITDDFDGIFLSQSLRTYAFDLVGKLKLPLDNGFYLFTLLGVDYIRCKRAPELQVINPFPDPDAIRIDRSRDVFSAEYGAGAGYAFTPRTHFELTWQHYQGRSKVDNGYLPNIDYFSLGFTYKFI
ncbi:MAG: outer membrane beta-barrel protein [Pseudomonadota bacterium]|nr:outer membrane beta-barrel protein [Pseudomonadota bacterium]